MRASSDSPPPLHVRRHEIELARLERLGYGQDIALIDRFKAGGFETDEIGRPPDMAATPIARSHRESEEVMFGAGPFEDSARVRRIPRIASLRSIARRPE